MAVISIFEMPQLSFITHMAQLSNSRGIAVVSVTHMAQTLRVSHGMTVIYINHMEHLSNSHGTAVISTTHGMTVMSITHMTQLSYV